MLNLANNSHVCPDLDNDDNHDDNNDILFSFVTLLLPFIMRGIVCSLTQSIGLNKVNRLEVVIINYWWRGEGLKGMEKYCA